MGALLGIDPAVNEALIGEQFQGKDRLIRPNLEALAMGREAAASLVDGMGLKVRRADRLVGDRIYIEGNSAAGLGAVFGGATVCAWYPITPSTSLAEAFTGYCEDYRTDPESGDAALRDHPGGGQGDRLDRHRGRRLAGNGARGVHLHLGARHIADAGIRRPVVFRPKSPAVIFDVQRGGPSTGMPTRTQQSDMVLAAVAYASHGDTKHVMLLFPEDPAECFEMGAQAFDLGRPPADDGVRHARHALDIGMMNEWLCRPLVWDDNRRLDRGKIMTFDALEKGEPFGRYRDVDGDGIPYRTLPGVHPSRGGYFTRGTSRDPDARYSEDGPVYVANMERLLAKFETAKSLVPALSSVGPRPAKRRTPHGVIYFGSSTPAMHESLEALDKAGVHVDAMRVRAFPFCDAVLDFIAAHRRTVVFVVEQNRDGQLRTLLMNEAGVDPAKLVAVLNYDGAPITARFITYLRDKPG